MDADERHTAIGFSLRVAAGLTAASLLFYVPYRYATRPPGFDGALGSAYALLFPLSLLLAVGTIAVAWRPDRLRRLTHADGGRERAIRGALGIYAGLWVAMGLICVPSLTALAEVSSVKGLFSTIHMSAQHVFLGFGAVVAAWRPAFTRCILEGRDASSAPGGGGRASLDPEPSRS